MTKTIVVNIADREIPSNIVYEDDVCIAFTDAGPLSKGHTLVIPRNPVPDIYDLDEETGAHIMKVVSKIANDIKDAFGPAGLNVVQNNGEYASQTVFHLHFHVIPRYEDEYDGFSYNLKQESGERTE